MKSVNPNSKTGLEIAVIGMAGRFASFSNINEFWDGLIQNQESIKFYSKEELREAGVEQGLLENKNYIRTIGSVLESKKKFDAEFFGFTDDEALKLLPQARILLELSWQALEDAGCKIERNNESIGIYAGSSASNIWENYFGLKAKNAFERFTDSLYVSKDMICSRISHSLNLTGPSVFINSMCSTSLVAIDMACKSLLNGQCSIALAGGIELNYLEKGGYVYHDGMITSSDGHCKAFDDKADGTINGEGGGIVALKCLDSAIKDGDYIYAVIKGGAVNNDGKQKIGFTAPSVKGQVDVIQKALSFSEVNPEEIDYVECHGTGTKLGDPIEISALTKAFSTTKKQYCGIGSVKTNIGHLNCAAGIAGFIKTVMILNKGIIPATLNYNTANPKIDFENSPFYVVNKNTELDKTRVNKACVSSFGISGTNAHIILEKFIDARKTRTLDNKHHLILLSAKTENALSDVVLNLKNYLIKNLSVNLGEMSYTLIQGKDYFKYRAAFVASKPEDLIDSINKWFEDTNSKYLIPENTGNLPVIFMFPGQGAQYKYMGKDLYYNIEYFRNNVDDCLESLKFIAGNDFYQIAKYYFLESQPEDKLKSIDINDTLLAQVLLFIFEYSLARYFIYIGINPSALTGHSLGEIVAASISNVLELNDAIWLVYKRGNYMASMDKGEMISIPLPDQQVQNIIWEGIEIAAENSSELCTVSGNSNEIEKLRNELKKQNIPFVNLNTSHAYHSYMMEPAIPLFVNEIKNIKFNKPVLPFLSNVSGGWISDHQATNPEYWGKHIRSKVHFNKGLSLLLENNNIFIEVGPGKTLSTFIKNHNMYNNSNHVVRTIPGSKEGLDAYAFVLQAIGYLWCCQKEINWSEFFLHQDNAKIPLPVYPFQGKEYWLSFSELISVFDQTIPQDNLKDEFYLYKPVWKRNDLSYIIKENNKKYSKILIISDQNIAKEFKSKFIEKGIEVTIAIPANEFRNDGENQYYFNLLKENHADELFKDLEKTDRVPHSILFIMEKEKIECNDTRLFDKYMSVFNRIKNIIIGLSTKRNQLIDFYIITESTYNVTGTEKIEYLQSACRGLCKALIYEYPNLKFNIIDIDSFYNENKPNINLVSTISDSILYDEIESVTAYRNNCNWFLDYDKINSNGQKNNPVIKEQGTYIIIGGLGRIGYEISTYLIQTYNANVSIIQRNIGNDNINNPGVDSRREKLESISQNVKFYSIDITNKRELEAGISDIYNKYSKINGVFFAAGYTELGLIKELDEEKIKDMFNTKFHGLKNLLSCIESLDLDFCSVFSSISSYFGGFGMSAYASINSIVDTYIEYINQNSKYPLININWDAWEVNTSSAPKKLENNIPKGISSKQALEALMLILGKKPCKQTLVLNNSVERFKMINTISKDADVEQYENNSLDNIYLDEIDFTETEKLVAKIWIKLLGKNKLKQESDFFELGGDSLKAMKFLNILTQQKETSITLSELFELRTLSEISKYIDKSGDCWNVIDDIVEQIISGNEK